MTPNGLFPLLCMVVALSNIDMAEGRDHPPRTCIYLGDGYTPGEIMYQVYDLDSDKCFTKKCGEIEESVSGECIVETIEGRERGEGRRPCRCRYDGVIYEPDSLITMILDGDNCTSVYCSENGKIEYEDEEIEECITTTSATSQVTSGTTQVSGGTTQVTSGTTDTVTESPTEGISVDEMMGRLKEALNKIFQRGSYVNSYKRSKNDGPRQMTVRRLRYSNTKGFRRSPARGYRQSNH